jgi:hypothetical protein
VAAPGNNSGSPPTVVVPRLDTPLVDLDQGRITHPWYRFLIDLYKKVGGSAISVPSSAYLALTPSGAIGVYLAATNQLLGFLTITSGQGLPATNVPVGASPFVYTAGTSGYLIVEWGEVEISRDGGNTWYQAFLVGCSLGMTQNDKARITYRAGAPTITFLPSF